MEFIDKRDAPTPTTTFEDLRIGDCYQDDSDNVCIKTSYDRCIYFDTTTGVWCSAGKNLDSSVTPLKATVTVERKA